MKAIFYSSFDSSLNQTIFCSNFDVSIAKHFFSSSFLGALVFHHKYHQRKEKKNTLHENLEYEFLPPWHLEIRSQIKTDIWIPSTVLTVQVTTWCLFRIQINRYDANHASSNCREDNIHKELKQGIEVSNYIRSYQPNYWQIFPHTRGFNTLKIRTSCQVEASIASFWWPPELMVKNILHITSCFFLAHVKFL